MSDIHNKLGVKKGGKPGDLISAFNAKKAAGVFKKKAKKHEKVAHCATCKKSHAKGKHEKKSAKKHKSGPQMSPASNGNLGGVPGQYKKNGKKEKKS